MKFPRDSPQRKVIKAFEVLGFKVVRVGVRSRLSSMLGLYIASLLDSLS